MSPSSPAHLRRGYPACVADAALLLLATGRPAMALRVLGPLPGLIRAAMATSRELGQARGELHRLRAEAAALRVANGVLHREIDRDHAELRRLGDAAAAERREPARLERPRAQARPRPPRPHELLTEALADGRVTAERAAGLLRMAPAAVAAIAAGRVGLPRAAWARVLAEACPRPAVRSGVAEACEEPPNALPEGLPCQPDAGSGHGRKH